jgi:hypothetical protein
MSAPPNEHAVDDGARRERIARSRAAVARIQARREIAARRHREARLDLALACVVATVILGLLALGVLTLMDQTGLGFAQLMKRSMVLIAVVWTIGLAFGILALILFGLAIVGVLYGTLGAPLLIAQRVRRARTARHRLELEARLARDGELLPEAGRQDIEHRVAIAHADGALRFEPSDGSVRPVEAGPPEACPRCRGTLAHPSPGVRRCAHCAFERFDELPARTEELVKARALIDRVQAGEPYTGDRDALRAKLRARSRSELPAQAGACAALAFGFALVGELGLALDAGWLKVIARVGMFLFMFPAGLMLPVALYQLYARRFRELKPGIAAYDQAIAVDIISTLAHQGVMTYDAMADHLGVTRGHLEQVLASLEAMRVAPAYHDPSNDRLISLHARAIDDDACPACGGQLVAGERATLRCRHCGGYMAIVAVSPRPVVDTAIGKADT